jgi:replicative DNA helicase
MKATTTPFMRQIEQTVQREIRQAGLIHESNPWLPPPCDVDAESEIVSALLSGYVRADELPLSRKDFYTDVLGAIFEATIDVAPGDLEGVRTKLITMGWRGALDDELKLVAFTQPWASLARVRHLAGLVVELAAQRKLLDEIERVDRGLRIGELDRQCARRLLAEAAA